MQKFRGSALVLPRLRGGACLTLASCPIFLLEMYLKLLQALNSETRPARKSKPRQTSLVGPVQQSAIDLCTLLLLLRNLVVVDQSLR